MEIQNYPNFNRTESKHDSFSFFGTNIFCSYKEKGFLWFRIFGYGLLFKNIPIHGLLFSERNGYKKVFKIGKWQIRTLNKEKN